MPDAEVRYFTATPHGELSVLIACWAVSAPVAGVIAYCDTLAEFRFVTKSQLSSPRIAIEVGRDPVATTAGLSAVKLPETAPIFRGETVLDSVPRT